MENELKSEDCFMGGELVKAGSKESDSVVKPSEITVDLGAGDSPRRRQLSSEAENEQARPLKNENEDSDVSHGVDEESAIATKVPQGVSDGHVNATAAEDEGPGEDDAIEESSGDDDSNEGFPDDEDSEEDDENTLSQRIYEIFESSKSSTLEGLFDRLVDSHHQLTLMECKNESCHRNFLNFMSDVKAFENYLRNPKPGIPDNKYLPMFYIYMYAKICSFALLDRKRLLNHICCEHLGRNPSWIVRDLLTASATTLWQLLPPKEQKPDEEKKEAGGDENEPDGRGDDGKAPPTIAEGEKDLSKAENSGDAEGAPGAVKSDTENQEGETIKSPSKEEKARDEDTDDLLPEHLIACCRLFAKYSNIEESSLKLDLGDFVNRVDAVFHSLSVPCTHAEDCEICKEKDNTETNLNSDQIGLFCASISDEIDLLKFQTENLDKDGDETTTRESKDGEKGVQEESKGAQSDPTPEKRETTPQKTDAEEALRAAADDQKSRDIGTSTDVTGEVGDMLRQFSPRELGKTWSAFVEFMKTEPSLFDKHLTLNELYTVVGTHIHFYCPWKLLLEREEVTYRTINNNLEMEKERVQRCLDYLAAMCEGITFPKDTVKRLFEHIAYYVEDDAFLLRFYERCRGQVDSEMGALDFTSEYDGAGEWTLGACVCGSNAD